MTTAALLYLATAAVAVATRLLPLLLLLLVLLLLLFLSMLPLASIHTSFLILGSAPILPYLTVVLRQMGVPGSYIALMISIKKILQQLIAAPLGGLMDK